MIRFFRLPQPASLIIIPVIVLLTWSRMILSINLSIDVNSMPLWKLICDCLNVLPSWINFIILAAIISFEAIYFNLVLNRNEVLYKSSFLPALVFGLLVCSTPALMQFHPVHIVNLIVLRILDRLFALFKNEFPVAPIFDTAFLAGIAALIYFPCILLFPFLLISVSAMKSLKIKEWLIVLIGFALPFFFLSTVLFWQHSLIPFWKSYFIHFRNLRPVITIILNQKLIILSGAIGLLFIISLIKLRGNFRKNVIRTRNFQLIMLMYFFASALMILLSKGITIIHFSFLIIPVSVFIAYWFLSAKKKMWIYEYSLYLLIALIVWNQF